jgi:F0F1-type ATP synthase assembly protein I
MLIETISPALSAFLGGLIVMLSNLLIQRYKEREKKQIFLRERLEEIYTLSLGAIDWLQHFKTTN